MLLNLWHVAQHWSHFVSELVTFSLVDGGGSACRGTSAGDNMPAQLGLHLCPQNVQHSVILIRPCQRIPDLLWIMVCHVHTFALHIALLHRSPPHWSHQLHRWNPLKSKKQHCRLPASNLAADCSLWGLRYVNLLNGFTGRLLIWLGLAWLPIQFCDPQRIATHRYSKL